MPVPPDYDGRGGGGHVELAEQRVGLLVGLEVDPAERDRVPDREIPQAVRVRAEPRAEDLDDGKAPAQQQLAPHQKRLDDGLAQVGQLIDGAAQLAGAQLEHTPGLAGPCGHDGGPAGEHVHVAREPACLVDSDRAGLVVGLLDDLDAALEHDVEAEAAVAGVEEDVTCPHTALVPARGERGDVRGTELGEGDCFVRGHRHALHGVTRPAAVAGGRYPEHSRT